MLQQSDVTLSFPTEKFFDCLSVMCFQALRIINDVGDKLRVKFSRIPAVKFLECDR